MCLFITGTYGLAQTQDRCSATSWGGYPSNGDHPCSGISTMSFGKTLPGRSGTNHIIWRLLLKENLRALPFGTNGFRASFYLPERGALQSTHATIQFLMSSSGYIIASDFKLSALSPLPCLVVKCREVEGNPDRKKKRRGQKPQWRGLPVIVWVERWVGYQ